MEGGVLHAAEQGWNIQRLQRGLLVAGLSLLIWIKVGTPELGALAYRSSSQGGLT